MLEKQTQVFSFKEKRLIAPNFPLFQCSTEIIDKMLKKKKDRNQNSVRESDISRSAILRNSSMISTLDEIDEIERETLQSDPPDMNMVHGSAYHIGHPGTGKYLSG